MFPGLFACCTIDWFLPWPQEALASVSEKFLSRFEISATPEVKKAIIQHCAFVHIRVTTACDEYKDKFSRQVYVTPKSYLTFIDEYQRVYLDKFQTYNKQQQQLKVGLDKLLEAGEDVEKMKGELKIAEKTLEEAQRVSKALLVDIQASTAKAEKKKNECAKWPRVPVRSLAKPVRLSPWLRLTCLPRSLRWTQLCRHWTRSPRRTSKTWQGWESRRRSSRFLWMLSSSYCKHPW